ncbi:MAG: adhesin, partial [Mesorhizobium sp.]
MATQVTGAGGTTASFSNTPQAKDDVFNLTEDTVVLASGSQTIIVLDVMANDQGGNAKSLFSVDDGISASTATKQYAPIDLTTQDVQATGISAWESIGGGVSIRINNGKVEMDLGGYLAAHGFASLQAMGAGDQINETFTYAIKLGNGTLSWASVSVNIQGTNDGAIITAIPGADTTVVEAGGVANGTLNDPNAHGQLSITDPDAGQNHFQAPPSLQGTYGTFTFDTTTGVWAYTLNQTLADPLTQGQHVTDTLTVKSADGSASYNILVNITGTNDVPVIAGTHAGSVTEDVATDASNHLNTSGALTINDVDQGQSNFTAQASFAGTYGTFTLDAAGNWTYSADDAQTAIQQLGAGQSITDSFTAVSSDGTASQLVTVTINGANDVPVGVNDTSASLGAVAATEKGGSLNASGGNNGTGNVLTNDTDVDSAGLTVSGIRTGGVEGAGTASSVGAGLVGAHGTLTLNSNGSYTYVVNENDATVQALNTGGSTTDTFNYTVSDGSLTDTAVLTVTINGANDAAVLSSASVNLTEANTAAAISTSGTLTISDVDSSATFVAQVGTAGSYGTFAINAAGAWTYTASSAHDEFVAGQHYTETFNVVSADGTPTTVHIDILGTSDNGAPVAVADTNWVKEDTNTSATGNVLQTLVHAGAPSGGFSDHADTDPDADTLAVSALTGGTDNGTTFTRTGTYGSLVVTKATGAYTYTLANGQANVQALAAGQTVTDSFTYTVSDGHGGTASANLDVTVFGTDEVTPGLITLVADGKQGSNAEPSTVTITFTTAVNANFANLSNVMHVSGLPNVSVIAGSGSFNAAHTQYTFQVDKGAGSSNGSSYTLNIDAGAFSDTTGHTNAAVSQGSLKPAGTSGEPINLALTDPSHEGALITVTVKDVPSGWTIDGATHNADGSWTVQTNDLHGLTVTTPADCT